MTLLANFADHKLDKEKGDDDSNHVIPEQNPKDNHFECRSFGYLTSKEHAERYSRDNHCENRDNQVLVPCCQNEGQPTGENNSGNRNDEFAGVPSRHRFNLGLDLVHDISLLVGWLAWMLALCLSLNHLRIKNKYKFSVW